jgi:ABC-type multidrug transport system ATPase subunit
VFLFDGSVRENIAYGRIQASDAEVLEAAQRANADEFIRRLPEGYDTIIGERGVKLSGGQRQRLSIARALLADPKILILDEATSSLDTESEQLIQASIDELLRDRTTFIIAHRLSTIAHADQIVVLDSGVIVEQGTHFDLLRRGGRYANMVARQSHRSLLEEPPLERPWRGPGARSPKGPRYAWRHGEGALARSRLPRQGPAHRTRRPARRRRRSRSDLRARRCRCSAHR